MDQQTIPQRYASAVATLEQVGQEHVLAHFDALDEMSKHRLLDDIETVDWPEVSRLVESHVKSKPMFSLPDKIDPAPWYPYVPTSEMESKYSEAKALGEQLIRDGKVAAFCVAGGQGSRLGYDGPKGCYPATPIRNASLFQCFAEYLHGVERKYHAQVPLYIMTSPINHDATVAYWQDNQYFGLPEDQCMFFSQAMMPAIDMQSYRVLMSAPDALALSPNGHGGSLKALHTSGALADMKQRGIEQISYIQVDNPLVKVVDPLFIGLHALDGAEMSSKMLPKREPMEKLGNFCVIDGKVTVIEYSNLPVELAQERTNEGELRFRAGSIALHVIRVDFVEALNTSAQGFSLPWNRAEKKVAFMAEDGTLHKPSEPNAVKLETFVFDALPQCDSSIVYETSRAEEFAPIKNADAADGSFVADSPSSSRRLQIDRAGRWLAAQGVEIPWVETEHVDAVLEVSQKLAIEPEDLEGVSLPPKVDEGGELFIG